MAIDVSDEIRRNFHLFWDNFPAAVILVHKDHTIIETNKMAGERGYPTGIKCFDMGERKNHAGCKAQAALRDKAAARSVAYYDFLGQVVDGYWIPLAGAEDFYVHFATDITEYAADRMFPDKRSDHACSSCGGA